MATFFFRFRATYRRGMRATREVYIALLTTLILTVGGWFIAKKLTADASITSILAEWMPWIVVGFIMLATIIFLKTRVEFRRDLYDVTAALKYSDKFDQMKQDRVDAAECLGEYERQLHKVVRLKQELEPIDTVLDFFDDLGFLLLGDQISDRVAHHFFYYWIRGYWKASETYIRAWQQRSDEELRWDYIEPLFAITDTVESRLARRKRIRLFVLGLIGIRQPTVPIDKEEDEAEEEDETAIFLQEEMDLLKPTKKQEKALEQSKPPVTPLASKHDQLDQIPLPGSHEE